MKTIGSKSLIAYFELSLAMIMVGGMIVVGKIIVGDFPVFLANEISLVAALIVIIPIQYFVNGKLPILIKRDYSLIFLQAIFGLFLFRVFTLYGLKLTGGIEAGVITSTIPAWTALIAFIILKERIGIPKGVGICLSVAGIVVINVFSEASGVAFNLTHLIGNALVLGAVIGEALFTVFRKSISEKVSSISITLCITLFGFIMFIPFAAYQLVSFDFSSVSTGAWIALLYYGIFGSAMGYLLWFDGVSKVEASTAGVFTAFMPISAVCLSSLLLNEAVRWFHIVGVAVVILGIIFSTLKEKRKTL